MPDALRVLASGNPLDGNDQSLTERGISSKMSLSRAPREASVLAFDQEPVLMAIAVAPAHAHAHEMPTAV